MKKCFLFVSFLFLFLSSLVSASPVPYASLSASDPLAPASLLNARNLVRHSGTQASNPLPPSMPFVANPQKGKPSALAAVVASDCNLAAMLALTTPAALVVYLQNHSSDCLQFLWTYDPRMSQIFTTNNLAAVISTISIAAASYNGTDDHHLDELLFFLRAAYYQASFNSLPFDKSKLKSTLVTVLDSLFVSPHIFDNTDVAGSILNEAVNVIDTAQLDKEMMPQLESTLTIFANQLSTRVTFYNQQLALYSTFYTLSRTVNNIALSAIDANLLSLLKSFSLMVLSDEYDYIADQAIWVLGQMGEKTSPWQAQAMAALEQAYYQQPQWSTAWLWSVRALTLGRNCTTLSTGDKVCLSTVKYDLKSRLFPKSYVYDNGTVNVRTALPKTQIDPLYYAMREVKAQFGRLTGNLNFVPVVNDPNANLSVVVYSSAADFSKYHSFLFDLSPNMGAQYVEQDGTYYTYQRTPAQDPYSLQEITRREYAHYLLGRYLEPGLWGSTALYDNNRLAFIEEGLEEFFAGSTSTQGVQQRASLVALIQSDGVVNYQSVSQILSSSYNNVRMYRYAGMLFHFFYTQRLDLFNQIVELVQSGDGAGIDALVNQLKSDAALNNAYQAYLQAAVANSGTLGVVNTLAPPVASLIYSTPAEIQSVLFSTKLVSQTSCSVSSSANKADKMFHCQGQFSGQAQKAQAAVQGWYALNSGVDQIIKATKTATATNMDWMNCWFGNLQWQNSSGGYIPSAQYACDGPLGSAVLPPAPPSPGPSQLQADFHKTRLGGNASCVAVGSTITCNVPTSTALVATSQDNSVITALISTTIASLQQDVVSLSPQQYANLSCTLKPKTIKIVSYTEAQKYASFAARCSL